MSDSFVERKDLSPSREETVFLDIQKLLSSLETEKTEKNFSRISLQNIDLLVGPSYGKRDDFLKKLGKTEEELCVGEKLGLDIIDLYLPYRHRISQNMTEEDKEEVSVGIRHFAETRFARAREALDEGDIGSFFMSVHNAATGFGMSGDNATQIRINKMLYEYLSKSDRDEDLNYTYQKIFSGLLENDAEFQSTFPLEDYEKFIQKLFSEHNPNFAGRAIVFAKRLFSLDFVEQSRAWLQRAAECQYSKSVQVQDAKALISSLFGKEI